jgi:hypothetical protein
MAGKTDMDINLDTVTDTHMLSPIVVITDMLLSAHLCLQIIILTFGLGNKNQNLHRSFFV